jgi:hypothetical protein
VCPSTKRMSLQNMPNKAMQASARSEVLNILPVPFARRLILGVSLLSEYMELQQFWCLEYRDRRYLEHLSDNDLAQRARDIISNYTVLSDKGQISLQPVEEEGQLWIRLFTHICEEYRLRKKWFPAGFMKDAPIPQPTWPDLPKSVKALGDRKLEQGNFLVKYGECEFLRPTLDEGRIHISPASAYDDPSLNYAIKDDELEITWLSLPSDNVIEVIDPNTGKPKRRLNPTGNVKYTLKASTNYYAYCLSRIYGFRLFDDFEADCCLIIKQPMNFIERLFREFDKRMPGWKGFAKGVSYVDPLNAYTQDIDVFFYKHFRYAYQKEFRMVWTPPEDRKELDCIDLELGNLEEYCELVSLER